MYIIRGVIHRPQVLFLDEPTRGLDITSRNRIWHFFAEMRRHLGITVLLTTHYLEEAADCDNVAFLKAGRVIDRGAPAALVGALGEWLLEVEAEQKIIDRLARRFARPIRDGGRATFRVPAGMDMSIAQLQAELGEELVALRRRRPTLNDVFLWLNEFSVAMLHPSTTAQANVHPIPAARTLR